MFKFLFRGKSRDPEVSIESDRARFERLVTELNEMIDTFAVKPRVTVDPATGHVLPEAPEQFADEALALPAPDPSSDPTPAEEPESAQPTETETPAEDAADAKAEQPSDKA